jgi:hypothetical protein
VIARAAGGYPPLKQLIVDAPLDLRGWGVLTHKHCDHHLRQFGA